ncbi:disintegrin and metalloproteinase domain-containing protein 17 [Mytilus galloprovincialis]|uniref:Disintegrin and metalloproteinase domain-containing protein 17 n=1 Tax=Mytilus galloprovincialis TaxID=29158 RepID=A0A8B6CHD7_MYTGA|nr:disintegrin and metalloproteinase domain-containing protein 17 [Mytilus galloprovincialis]
MRILIFLWIAFIFTTLSTGDETFKLKYFETLKSSDIRSRVRRSPDPNPASRLHEFWFSSFGRDFHLMLKQSSVVTRKTKVTLITPSGGKVENQLNLQDFFTGTIAGDDDAHVEAHWEDNLLSTYITTADDIYIIEPSWRVLGESTNHSLIAYRKSDVKLEELHLGGEKVRFCAQDDKYDKSHNRASEYFLQMAALNTQTQTGQSRVKRENIKSFGTKRVCKLFLVADFEFHKNVGDGRAHTTANYIIGTLNKVNEIFRRTKWPDDSSDLIGLGFEIAELQIHQNYSAEKGHYNYGPMKNWTANTLLQANLALPRSRTELVSLSHNWGSEHDPDTSDCAPPSERGGHYLMYPYAVTGYDQNNKFFSQCSKQYIFKVLESKGPRCFTESSDVTFCGNGKLEEDEECDAGYYGDNCCDRDCKLKPGAICSGWNYECCVRSTCKIADKNTSCGVENTLDCKGDAVCNGSSLNCPEPRIKNNGRPCIDGGICKDGVCLNFCEIKGKVPCICDPETGYACFKCCKYNTTNSTCQVDERIVELTDGRPCYHGYCESGHCKKQVSDMVQRLFSIIENITADEFVAFMKSNIVGTIIIFSLVLWIPASCTFSYFDRKNDRKLKRMRSRMNNVFILDEDKNKIRHAGNFKLKPAGSIIRQHGIRPLPTIQSFDYLDTERESKV